MIHPLLLAAGRRTSPLPAWNDPPTEHFLDLDFKSKNLTYVREHFNIYGESPAGNTHWGTGSPQYRAGRYSPDAITFDARGMVFTMDPAYNGGTRYKTPADIDAWWAAYVRHEYIPKYFDASVRTKFDTTAGHWTAPIWFGRSSPLLEMDVEWFPNRPSYIRFALHTRFDGDSSTTNNVSTGGGVGSHEYAIVDLDDWHVYRCVVLDDGSGGMIFRWYVDGALLQERTTVEIETRYGKTMNNAIAGAYPDGGWTLDLSVNAGGVAVGYPDEVTSVGSEMITEWLTVDDLT